MKKCGVLTCNDGTGRLYLFNDMKIMQGGYYDILFTAGVIVTGLSACSIVLCEGHYEIFSVGFQLLLSVLLFPVSWITLSLFTHDILHSATASARTAGVYFALSAARVTMFFLLTGLTLSGSWAAVAYFSEIVVVCVGMSYLHLLTRKKGLVSGLIISVAFIAFIFIFLQVA